MLVNIIILLLLILNIGYHIASSASTLKNVRVDVCYVVCTIVKIIYIILSLFIYIYIPCIYAYIRMYMFMYVCYLRMGMCQAFLLPWQIPRICSGGSSIFEIVSPEG
jgi:hypothetical protein